MSVAGQPGHGISDSADPEPSRSRLHRVPDESTLVDRAAELRMLREAGSSIRAGSGTAVVLQGGPGIGKSALLHAAVAELPRVLFGRADRLSSQRPFGVLLNMLHDYLPAVSVVDNAELGELLRRLIVDRCAAGPTTMAIDDLHWADDGTLAVLQRLAVELPRLPLLLVGAVRPHECRGEVHRLLAELSRQEALSVQQVRPLDGEGLRALARSVLGREPDDAVLSWLSAAGGNPRYALTLLTAIHLATGDEPLPAWPTGTPTGWQREALASIRRVCEVDLLPEPVRRLLSFAAMLGPRFEPRELSIVAATTLPELLPSVQTALDADLLEEASADRLRFRHEIVRESLYAALSEPVRRELHRGFARALDAGDAEPEVVAHHLLRGSRAAVDVGWVGEVAGRLAERAPALAAELWSRDLDLLGVGDPRRLDARTGIVTAELALGRLRGAEQLAREALAERAGSGVGRLPFHLCTSLFLQGRWADLLTAAEEAAGGEGLSSSDRAEALAFVGLAALFKDDLALGVSALRRAEEALGDDSTLISRLRVQLLGGHLAHRQGDLGEASARLDDAVRLSRQQPTTETRSTLAASFRAMALLDSDRGADAEHELDRAVAEAAVPYLQGRPRTDVLTCLVRARLLLESGRLDDALAAVDASQVPDGGAWETARRLARAQVLVYRDGDQVVERELANALAETGQPDCVNEVGLHRLPLVLAALLAAREDVTGALEQLTAGWAAAVDSGLSLDLVPIGLELVNAASAAGAVEHAAEAARMLAELAAANRDVRTLAAAARTAEGLVHNEPSTLLEAAGRWQGSPRRLLATRAEELSAQRLAELGQRPAARELANRAMNSYQAMGARYRARQLRSMLRSTGTRQRRRRASRPATGWDALTPTERVVARYVELGHTNAEIAERMVISRRTVESHVSHILAKLQIRSRSALIVSAARHGRIPDQE